MTRANDYGQIIILNGVPRSGKSSIAAVIMEKFEGPWLNLGVDKFKNLISQRFSPGIGLRPGGERPDLEPWIVLFYAAMYESIADHSRMGLNVVTDVGHHDSYSIPAANARILSPGLFYFTQRCTNPLLPTAAWD